MELLHPEQLTDACELLAADPDASMPIAGGTALVLLLGHGFVTPDRLVSLRGVAALRGLERRGDVLRIGATETLRDIARSPLVRDLAPSLADACGLVGNTRVRNAATIGGNLAEADHASDPPPVLASLGATCVVSGRDGERRVPVVEFVTGYLETVLEDGELITAIEVPLPHAGAAPVRRDAVYHKFRTRSTEDRACVGVAACADTEAGAIRRLEVVIGAVAGTPQLVADATDAVIGGRLDAAVAARVADAYAASITPIDDARGSAWYRTRVIRVLVHRALLDLATSRDDRG